MAGDGSSHELEEEVLGLDYLEADEAEELLEDAETSPFQEELEEELEDADEPPEFRPQWTRTELRSSGHPSPTGASPDKSPDKTSSRDPRRRGDGTSSSTSPAQKRPRGNLPPAPTFDGDRKKDPRCFKKYANKVDSHASSRTDFVCTPLWKGKPSTSSKMSRQRCGGQKLDGRCSSRSYETRAMSRPSTRLARLCVTSFSARLPPARP